MKGWLARLGLRFENDQTESEFHAWLTDRWLGRARIVLPLSVIAYTVGILIADRLAAKTPSDMLTLRIGVALVAALVASSLHLARLAWVRAHWEYVVVATATVAGLGMGCIPHPPYDVGSQMTGVAITAFGGATLFGIRTKLAFVVVLALLAPYTAVLVGSARFTATTKSAWMLWFSLTTIFSVIGAYLLERSHRFAFHEQRKSDTLLHNVLPSLIADRLRNESTRIAEDHRDVTVLFADLVGFTQLTKRRSPSDLVDLLDQLFLEFDYAAEKHGLEKIKTIGDAYMAAAGVPRPRSDHSAAAAAMAVDMLRIVGELDAEDLDLRVGIHTGPVVAGVIGKKRFQYDLWGETVNIASRLETHGVPGRIHVSRAVRLALDGHYDFESRGMVALKGVGEVEAYLLRCRA